MPDAGYAKREIASAYGLAMTARLRYGKIKNPEVKDSGILIR
jgi:hypothetical protein